jgi:shikimate dehydrogenase
VQRGTNNVVVGLIGSGIGASFSPALHEREAVLLGFDYEYRLLDLDELEREPEDVGALVSEAQREGLRGLNITHPCKQLVLDALDELSDEAAALGAVNTVVFHGERRIGHNTDASGFREAFERRLPGARTGHVVLVGAGGAGAAVGYAILAAGAGRLSVVDVDPERAAALAAALGPCATAADLDALAGADGLIHASPTGMDAHPGSAVPAELLDPRHWVAEVVYMPLETQLLADARERGCRTLDGAAMVALQAAGSLELFTGARPDRERMLEHVDELIAETRQAA